VSQTEANSGLDYDAEVCPTSAPKEELKRAMGMKHVCIRLNRRDGDAKGPEGRQNLAGDVSPRCNVIPALSPARVPAAKPPGRGRARLKVATNRRLAPPARI
jgi:hypothetical protein